MVRITTRLVMQRALRDVNNVQQRLAVLQDRLASGKRISKPSDDPAGMTRALSIRGNIGRGTQYLRNMDSAAARLNATEASLSSLTDIIQRARELALTGANASLDPSQRGEIAEEVKGLLNEAVAVGNTKFAGQFVFSGYQSTTTAFSPVGTPITAVTYNGDAGTIQREISDGTQVQVNTPGDVAFSATFAALIDLRDHLQNGDLASLQSTDLQALDNALDGVLQVRGGLGATLNRLDLTRQRLDESHIASKLELADLEDADFVETVVDMNGQQVALEAALQATARSVQATLLDFLR